MLALRIRLNAETGLLARLRGAFGPLLASIVLFAAGPALAQYTYTDFLAPSTPGELSHEEILETTYGGDFVADGLNFHNVVEDIWAYRVWDSNLDDETVHIVSGDYNDVDQVWTDGAAQVTAIARYADMDQSFGWNGGGLDTTYIELLTDADIGIPVEIEILGDFLWGYQPNTSEWWSLNSENGGFDHMITYMIQGLGLPDPAPTVWMVFWEDLDSPGWDRDYNDIVVELRATPEPSALLLLGVGLLGLVLGRRARPSA